MLLKELSRSVKFPNVKTAGATELIEGGVK